ncbi:MAG TPA: hypothetical protein VKR55_16115 [Bradyrhizobium sp.]|uniref:hypothetical protein n=1 Tax=Bradyrhizobium sp. TaxID=376 RepID=UPI002BEC0246|nr:hypothetical protein [Bradyrhizobium sp.]HLZ03658.1 hypothetical protein [Bradyrhizobium sp.]
MRVVLAAVIIASLATPALAQQQHMQQAGEPDHEKTPAELAADKAAADAYKRSLGAIPDQGPVDPWGDVRNNKAPKPAATKTAKAKAKNRSAEAKPQ